MNVCFLHSELSKYSVACSCMQEALTDYVAIFSRMLREPQTNDRINDRTEKEKP